MNKLIQLVSDFYSTWSVVHHLKIQKMYKFGWDNFCMQCGSYSKSFYVLHIIFIKEVDVLFMCY